MIKSPLDGELNPTVVTLLRLGIGNVLREDDIERVAQSVIDHPDGWTSNRLVLSLLVGQITLASVAATVAEDQVTKICHRLAEVAMTE